MINHQERDRKRIQQILRCHISLERIHLDQLQHRLTKPRRRQRDNYN